MCPYLMQKHNLDKSCINSPQNFAAGSVRSAARTLASFGFRALLRTFAMLISSSQGFVLRWMGLIASHGCLL
jgi:hypothetical protein